MSGLIVLCPTRGRPRDAAETYNSFHTTAAWAGSKIVFVIDEDDPSLDEYLVKGLPTLAQPAPGNMVAALNQAALALVDTYDTIGFIGDDHRFRTLGWDLKVRHALERMGGGIVYGDDLAQRANLPTQVFMSSKIIKALGWMGLPTCHHLYIDNAWLVIGTELGRIEFLPDVVIEHLHPAYGKGEWDAGHVRVNTQDMYSHDGEAFNLWLRTDAPKDVERARAAL